MVSDDMADAVMQATDAVADTGRPGDREGFAFDSESMLRTRAGERDPVAV